MTSVSAHGADLGRKVRVGVAGLGLGGAMALGGIDRMGLFEVVAAADTVASLGYRVMRIEAPGILLTADAATFDTRTRIYALTGNVVLTTAANPTQRLSALRLLALSPSSLLCRRSLVEHAQDPLVRHLWHRFTFRLALGLQPAREGMAGIRGFQDCVILSGAPSPSPR